MRCAAWREIPTTTVAAAGSPSPKQHLTHRKPMLRHAGGDLRSAPGWPGPITEYRGRGAAASDAFGRQGLVRVPIVVLSTTLRCTHIGVGAIPVATIPQTLPAMSHTVAVGLEAMGAARTQPSALVFLFGNTHFAVRGRFCLVARHPQNQRGAAAANSHALRR